MIKNNKVHAYIYEGYWEDIGQISDFFEATLNLAVPVPQFNLYDEEYIKVLIEKNIQNNYILSFKDMQYMNPNNSIFKFNDYLLYNPKTKEFEKENIIAL